MTTPLSKTGAALLEDSWQLAEVSSDAGKRTPSADARLQRSQGLAAQILRLVAAYVIVMTTLFVLAQSA
jgi:hypothetical protein